MFRRRIAVLLVCITLAPALAVPAMAQSSSGKIVGTVRITGGNPAVGATVTVTSKENRISRVVRATAGGAYEVADLPPGLYTVSAELQGLRKVTLAGQRLLASQPNGLPLD